MKKLFTLSVLLAFIGSAAFAQFNLPKSAIDVYHNIHKISAVQLPTGINKIHPHNAGSRAGVGDTIAFAIDYSANDALYSSLNGFDFYYVGDVPVNTAYSNTNNFTQRWLTQIYDTLIVVDGQNSTSTFFPRAKTQMNLDSFDVYFLHERAQGNTNPDSILIEVYNRNTLTFTGSGPAGVMNYTPIWDTLIVTTTQLPVNVNNLFSALTFYPDLSFPLGQTFGIRITAMGDTANKVIVPAGFRDECANSCAAEPSVSGLNSLYYFNYTATNNTNISGINSVGIDCDQDGTVGTPHACEEFYFQNFYIFPYVTAAIEYGVAIVADSLTACPNSAINLTANGFGSAATPYTYQWAATGGASLTSTTDPTVALVLGSSSSVVSVTVTDANNNTAVSSLTITSKGININITNNPQPVVLSCGNNATITTQISGTTQGKNYSWSTGAAGANVATIQVNNPGTYRVTVTNASGCSATASVAVTYAGGITNNVSFTVSSPVCANKPATFTNTTSSQTNWTWDWVFGDTEEGFTQNPTHTYTSPGSYSVTLKADSAGCSFTSAPVNVTVLVASNPLCLNSGIDDVDFTSLVSLMPNPTNGNLNVTVSSVEKNISIKMYNVLGSEVISYNGNVSGVFTKTFDLSNLTNGTYLVKIQSGDKIAVKKVSVSK